MKKIAFYAGLVFVGVLLVAACSKDGSTSVPDIPAYVNPENPFDGVGQRHNECLEVLDRNNPGKLIHLQEIFGLLAENGFEQSPYLPGYANNLALLLSSTDPMTTLTHKMLKDGQMSPNLYAAFVQLKHLVEKNAFSAELAAAVIKLERNIPNLNLTEKERKTLYSATSIARYSNEYWRHKKSELLTQRDRNSFVLFCDIVGALSDNGDLSGDAAAAFSFYADLWIFFGLPEAYHADSGNNEQGQTRLPDLSWLFGHRWTMEDPCHPAPNSICGLSTTAGSSDGFAMSGNALALSPSVVVLYMDGSRLDPVFFQQFDTGVYPLDFDYTVPDELLQELYGAGGLDAPGSPTVFISGPKEVISLASNYCMLFPVAYEDGTVATWYVNIMP